MQKPIFINLNEKKQNTLRFDKPGRYIVFFENLSGELNFELRASKTDVDIYGLYTGKNAEKFTIKTKQHHISPDAKSNLLIKGIFDDSSSFHYEGLIKIEKKAQQSHAYQKNQNIILSSGVFVRSEPFLEILANEVFCTHGSTTGKLNEDNLYYLMTRGLTKVQSKKLLLKGFLNDVYQKLADDNIYLNGRTKHD